MTGRWLSRDPIGETGGVNIINFVKNNSCNEYDVLGLISMPSEITSSCGSWYATEYGEEEIRNRSSTEFTEWVMTQAASVTVRVYSRDKNIFETQETRRKVIQEERNCVSGWCDSNGVYQLSTNVSEVRSADRWEPWTGGEKVLVSTSKELKTIQVGGM